MDTQSEEFKNIIKKMNYSSKTAYEQHLENQEQFKNLMPALRTLDEEESEILLHLLENKRHSIND